MAGNDERVGCDIGVMGAAALGVGVVALYVHGVCLL